MILLIPSTLLLSSLLLSPLPCFPSCLRFSLCPSVPPSLPPSQIRIVIGSIALAVVLVCLEVRVVFTSFSHYVHYPPPFNYLLVTVAVFGLGFGFAAHVAGVLRGFLGSAVVTVVLLGSAVAAALVAGMPVFVSATCHRYCCPCKLV